MAETTEIMEVKPKRTIRLTKAGMDLFVKTMMNKPLKITRAALGDGKIPDGLSIDDMTEMVNPRMNIPIVGYRQTGTGTAVLEFEIMNAELGEGFMACEAGLYAIEPDTEEEVLYAYRNVGDYFDWIPEAASGELLNEIWNVHVAIAQSDNIIINITEAVGGVTRAEYHNHIKDLNPHPNFLQVGSQTKDCAYFFVSTGSKRRLEIMTPENARIKLLGENSLALPLMSGRLNQIEAELANIGIRMMSINGNNLSNTFVYEDFDPADEIDDTTIKVTSITAGSRTINLESLTGLMEGSWYTVTDGIRSEQIQIKSLSHGVGNDTYRIIATKDIINTFNINDTYLYRSTAEIGKKQARGSADRQTKTWIPSITWSGLSANSKNKVKLETTLDKSSNFTLTGDCKFTADGFMTLDTTTTHRHVIGLRLAQTGGGKGKWQLIEEDGSEYTGD